MAEKEIKEVKAEKAASKKENKPEKVKKDKPSLFSRIVAWFKSCKSEMKKVVWASWSNVWSNTVMVLVCIIVVAAALGAVDYIFNQGINLLNILI